MSKATHIVTGRCRFESVNLLNEGGSSLSLVISKRDKKTIKKIRDAVEAAILEGVARNIWPERPPFVQDPLREYDADNYFLNTYNPKYDKPGLVGPELEAIRPEDLKSGDEGRAALDFYAYDYRGREGVSVTLNNLQLLEAAKA